MQPLDCAAVESFVDEVCDVSTAEVPDHLGLSFVSDYALVI